MAQVLDGHREVSGLAAERLFLVVVREDDVEFALVSVGRAEKVVLKTGDEPVLAEDERHAIRRAAGECDSIAGADEGQDGIVALLAAAVRDRLERTLVLSQLVENLLDHGLVDGLDFRLEAEMFVVADRDVWPDLHDRLEDERLALFALGDLHFG